MSDHPLRVAVLGGPGTYSDAAAIAFFGDSIEAIGKSDFDAIFKAVTNGHADRGIVPIENSLAGSIHRNYDLLLRHDLSIIGESQIHIAHQLLALPGVELADIKRVYSHAQPLSQCEHTLRRVLPNVEQLTTRDTVSSVKLLIENNATDSAALASERAAKIYGLNILKADMQDSSENYTRFVVISPEPVVPQADAKTSIVFSMDNVPGSLFKSLAVFALRDIDLTKIESRPLQDKRWQYFFYIDFIGSLQEERCQNALNHLQEITSFFKVLGSYPRGC
ncbi:MAG: prephenate dehydratase [Anaerolineae bacterium]|nr:prephenate dehydratase [Anaerolineae bacterium]